MCWSCARGWTPLDRESTCFYRLFSLCWPCARGCTFRDEDLRASTGSFRCVGPVHVAIGRWTWFHVHLPAPFAVLARCTWLHASGRGSTSLYRFSSVCWPFTRGCTRLDADPRTSTGSFGSARLMNVAVRLWTWIHLPPPVLFGVFALCTWLYTSRRGSMRLYRLFSVCLPRAR